MAILRHGLFAQQLVGVYPFIRALLQRYEKQLLCKNSVFFGYVENLI